MSQNNPMTTFLSGKSFVNRDDPQVKFLISRQDPVIVPITYKEGPTLENIKASDLKLALNDKNQIIYQSRIPIYTEDFLDRVDQMIAHFHAAGFGVPGQVILAKIAYESAGTYLPHILNALGYIGLIQFNTAEESYRNLFKAGNVAEMINCAYAQTNIDQLTQVEQYLMTWLTRNKTTFEKNNFQKDADGATIIDAATLYCLTFLPAFASKPLDTDLAVEWGKLGKSPQDLIARNKSLSPDGLTIPKYYLAEVLQNKTHYLLEENIA